ncbi:hypothetical protein HGP28_18360 [Vibrio sp. SM6]|uniref:Uncharacterized protein n=1 Tax=Vibrio agarilyticus TaxID=2726741 RepID=A0A7X8TTV9_9VIBR|nr:hypothetical protein [Vibrio agarilyticus]NLS14825.1 hypothetical protein [Vibrio agarilyticus]
MNEVLIHYAIIWAGVSLVGGIVGRLFGCSFFKSAFTIGGLYLLWVIVKAATRKSY